MRNSSLLKWTQNVSNKSGKENKNWIHPPETLQKGHIAYLVKFMGSVEVEQPKGFNVVREAIRKLRFNQQIRKSSEGTKLPKVELTISIDGITIQDPKTKTIMHQYPLYRISYCADDKVERQFISFIVKEQDSEQHTCFVFLSDKLSEEITVTIGQAFELAYKSSANKPNKLSFRARQLDVSKPMPIYMSEDLSDLAETTEIKRAVPQMPTGMEKDEECEHHLQRAIFSGTVIPTPEVTQLEELEMYLRTYPAGSHMPKQLVRMHPFALEPEHPDYDADSEDEAWVATQGKALGVDVDKFEAIIDRLDKNSNFSVITLPESKALLKESDAVVTAVYDYWLSKRLRLQHSLIPAVKTEAGSGPANDPYIAFRRRKDKMQTRKNRKNDETSYEKMLKLKKDLSYAHSLFQMVQRRESIKLQLVRLHMELYQKRYEAKDFTGSLLNEVKSWKRTSSSMGGGAGALYNSASLSASAAQAYMWSPKPKELLKRNSSSAQTLRQSSAYYLQDDSSGSPKKERRHYKKRKRQRMANGGYDGTLLSSDEEPCSEGSPLTASSSGTDENPFSFKRQRNCSYLAPIDDQQPWDYDVDEEFGDEKRRFYAAYVSIPRLRSVGFARRRLGRGGRLLLDRAGLTLDDVWSSLDYTIKESGGNEAAPLPELAKYKPRSPCTSGSESDDDDAFYESDGSTSSSLLKPLIEVENLMYPAAASGATASDRVCLELELNAPLKHEATYALLDRIATHIENCNRDLVANASTTAGRWSGGASPATEVTGSILERWTKSHKNGGSVGVCEGGGELGGRKVERAEGGRVWRRPAARANFNLEDGETIGCSTFRTVTGEYFENVFREGAGKNGGCGGGNGVEYTLEKGNHSTSVPTSLSQLLNDCESLGFRDALLRKT